jgi:hypothetical protein
MSAQCAMAAPAPAPAPVPAPVPAPAPAPAPDAPVAVPENWAAASAPAGASVAVPDKAVIRTAIKASFEEEAALAAAKSKAAAIPVRFTASSQPEQDKYQRFEAGFAEAKVPGCLKSDGLKRQPTFFLGGLLALPFIAVAAVRGKCN